MKNNNIPEYILCPTPELARQVLEKIERESDLRWKTGENPTSGYHPGEYEEVVFRTSKKWIEGYSDKVFYIGYNQAKEADFTKAEDFLNNNYMTNKTWDNLNSCECERCSKCGKLVNR